MISPSDWGHDADLHAATTLRILNKILASYHPRDFIIRLWNGVELNAETEPRFILRLKHPGALRRMFLPPTELALGESFLRDDFDIEGYLTAAFQMGNLFRNPPLTGRERLALLRDLLSLPNPAKALVQRPPSQLRGQKHSRARDRAAVSYHYDVGNDFFALWLDQRLVYSCGYFPNGDEDLDQAQEKKLELICRKLDLREGERLLDIGCGWGGLIIYAAEHYGVHALGVTLSENQARLANERIAEHELETRAQVELRDYRELPVSSRVEGDSRKPFDKIVSVGMFEHVGRSRLPEYFEHAFRLLKPGGRFLNHGIALGAFQLQPRGARAWIDKLAWRWSFAQKYVFPDGELVSVNDANQFAERAGFEVRDVESLREHYERTLRHWVARLESNHAAAIRATNETTYRVWRLYMAFSAYNFHRNFANVYQSLMVKPDAQGTSRMPLNRAGWYGKAVV